MPSFKLAFSLSALLWTPSNGQLEGFVPEGLLGFLPANCMPQLTTDVLPCALENACFTLLPTDEEVANIPSESEIQSCADVEAGLCPITSRCPECKEVADNLFKCIILGNSEDGALSQEVTDLVMGCSLDCTMVAEEEVSDAPILAPLFSTTVVTTIEPTPAPTEETLTTSSAPTDVEVEAESEESAESGAVSVTRMASGAAIMVGLVSMVL